LPIRQAAVIQPGTSRVNAGFLEPLVQHPERTYSLSNRRTGELVATRLEPAFDSVTRRRGLLGRNGLKAGTGLVIAPSNSVHTFFMRFAIDLIFVMRDGRVAKVRQRVGPWRMAASVRAFAVIELPAGTLAGTDVRAGDPLEVVARESGGART